MILYIYIFFLFTGIVNAMFVRVNTFYHGLQSLMIIPGVDTAIGCAKICSKYLDCEFLTFVSGDECTLYRDSPVSLYIPCASLKCYLRNYVYQS